MAPRPLRLLSTLLVGAALALGQASVAFAGAATDMVKAKQDNLYELLKKSTPDAQKKISAIFDEVLDYDSLAESSLGKAEWEARSDAEKKEFSDLLKQLVRKAYERNLKKTLNYNVSYDGEDQVNGSTIVKTKAASKTNEREEPISVNYKLSQRDGKWRIQDIITEDVSLVGSYRSQFTKIVKKDGFPALIKKMKDKLAKGDV